MKYLTRKRVRVALGTKLLHLLLELIVLRTLHLVEALVVVAEHTVHLEERVELLARDGLALLHLLNEHLPQGQERAEVLRSRHLSLLIG